MILVTFPRERCKYVALRLDPTSMFPKIQEGDPLQGRPLVTCCEVPD